MNRFKQIFRSSSDFIVYVLILLLNNIYKRIRYKKRANIEPNDSESSNSELSHDPQDAPYGDENENENEEHID